jgi:hypothetical protein
MKIIYIYDKDLKFVTGIYADSEEKFESDPKGHYKNWEDGYCYSDKLLENPILEDGKLKEKEKEIIPYVPTKEQLMEEKISYILEYSKLEENKKVVESSKFSTEDEIKAITEKMAVLEGYINTLSEKIKAL